MDSRLVNLIRPKCAWANSDLNRGHSHAFGWFHHPSASRKAELSAGRSVPTGYCLAIRLPMVANNDLKPIEPDRAVEKYLQHRKNEEVSKKTLQAHRYRLSHFTRWCNEENIESMDKLSVRHLQDFRHWRKEDGDLNNVSWHTQMTTFRVFIKWAENYQAVPVGHHERIDVPKMDPDEDARDETFSSDRAAAILGYLERFEYASKKHTLFALLWHTGIRIGTARALDLRDFNENEQYIKIRHRPTEGTSLKNSDKGERPISLATPEVEIIRDYIETVRQDVTDEYGRKPLFTTSKGRAHRTTLRSWVYRLARPCTYRDGYCPHDRDPENCEAIQLVSKASKCPSSFSPHTIRRSSITKWLSEDVPKEAVSDRMNVNDEALEKHYDKRSEMGKMNQRKDYFS